MESTTIFGLVGAVASVALITFLSERIRNQATYGTLRWGWALVALAAACLAIAGLAFGAFFYDDNVRADSGEVLAVIGLIVGFGLGAVFLFVEYYFVHGSYDDNGIEFYTPWSGSTVEDWRDLRSAEFRADLYCYVLKFESGKTIRLSNLLSGHGGVVRKINQMGYALE